MELVEGSNVRVGGSDGLTSRDDHKRVFGKVGHRELDLHASEWNGLTTSRDRERIGGQFAVEDWSSLMRSV